jgi:hypothetical protein
MKRAAIGIRAHSGWAAAVAVAGSLTTPEVLVRERIVVIDADGPRANQPYHFAKNLSLPGGELYLAECAKIAGRLGAEGLKRLTQRVCSAGYDVMGCAILTASGRPVPGLEQILASHAMIHTAEGEFFRKAFVDACDHLKIPVTRIRDRDLLDRAAKELRIAPAKTKNQLATTGRGLGPPWTQDQKNAALAAWLLLGSASKPRR